MPRHLRATIRCQRASALNAAGADASGRGLTADRALHAKVVNVAGEQERGRSAEARAAWDNRERLVALAREVAPTLVGLSPAEAQRVVDLVPGLHIRFVGDKATADFGYGRITASVRDGLVADAAIG